MNSDSESKDVTARSEKEHIPSRWNRLYQWLKTKGFDWSLMGLVGAGLIYVYLLASDIDKVKEDIESIKARVIRTETMAEDMRDNIRDVHRDAAYITGRLDGADIESAVHSQDNTSDRPARTPMPPKSK